MVYIKYELSNMPDALPDTFIYMVQNRCRVIRWGNWYMSNEAIFHINSKDKEVLKETLLIFEEYCKIMNCTIILRTILDKFPKS